MRSANLTAKILTILDLSAGAQQLLFENGERLKLKDQDFLLTKGKICTDVWFVELGCIKLATNGDGKEINLNFSLQGEFITDLKSLRLGIPSENYIQSRGPSNVIGFKKSRLQELYEQSDEISAFGRQLLEQLLGDQEEHANLFKLKSPAERYNHILARRPLLLQKVTLTELASYLGISRETLTRIRQAK